MVTVTVVTPGDMPVTRPPLVTVAMDSGMEVQRGVSLPVAAAPKA